MHSLISSSKKDTCPVTSGSGLTNAGDGEQTLHCNHSGNTFFPLPLSNQHQFAHYFSCGQASSSPCPRMCSGWVRKEGVALRGYGMGGRRGDAMTVATCTRLHPHPNRQWLSQIMATIHYSVPSSDQHPKEHERRWHMFSFN